jgi:NAD(P)-dependent dehydrogenase (short-subunit alcohol dehydrogenase family)
MSADTVIWISGATEGIGLGLARNQPYPNARIVNLSRRPHPDYESVVFDLTEPDTWDVVRRHFQRELAAFTGKRAIFIHNAYYSEAVGLVGKVDSGRYEKSVLANVAAPLVLGEAFVTACRPGYEAGLVMLSSGAAVSPLPGLATYCAAKTAIEHWVQVVAAERQAHGRGPWLAAVRPGGVETAPVRRVADLDPEVYPRAGRIKANIPNRLDIDAAARQIWSVLPPDPAVPVVSFAPELADPAFRFDGPRVRTVDVPGWRLVYA